ncbi:MAG: VWA domain-containing protein [Sedimentisphaerales bacterium]|nr:VWA domain-containing protein [Sedimentisphaerales bacterium]
MMLISDRSSRANVSNPEVLENQQLTEQAEWGRMSISAAGSCALPGAGRGIGRRKSVLQEPVFVGWAISVMVHVFIASVFLLVTFSGSSDRLAEKQTPAAQVQPELEALLSEPMIQDLQVEPVEVEKLFAEKLPLPAVTEVEVAEPFGGIEKATRFGGESVGTGLADVSLGGDSFLRSRFCGTGSLARRICYVVDNSGSMIMARDYVRRELKRAVANLTPAQYFYIIFYAGSDPQELGSGRLIRAAAHNRRKAQSFVEQTELVSVANAEVATEAVVKALTRALTISADDGNGAEVVYLLTDGQYDQQVVKAEVKKLQSQRTQPARINVISCGVRDNEKFLRTLAAMYGGQYRFVSDEQLSLGASDRGPE